MKCSLVRSDRRIQKEKKEKRNLTISRRIDKLSGALSTSMTREFCGKPKSIVGTDYLLVASRRKRQGENKLLFIEKIRCFSEPTSCN